MELLRLPNIGGYAYSRQPRQKSYICLFGHGFVRHRGRYFASTLSVMSQLAMMHFKNELLATGKLGKKLLGALLFLLGFLVITDWDK